MLLRQTWRAVVVRSSCVNNYLGMSCLAPLYPSAARTVRGTLGSSAVSCADHATMTHSRLGGVACTEHRGVPVHSIFQRRHCRTMTSSQPITLATPSLYVQSLFPCMRVLGMRFGSLNARSMRKKLALGGNGATATGCSRYRGKSVPPQCPRCASHQSPSCRVSAWDVEYAYARSAESDGAGSTCGACGVRRATSNGAMLRTGTIGLPTCTVRCRRRRSALCTVVVHWRCVRCIYCRQAIAESNSIAVQKCPLATGRCPPPRHWLSTGSPFRSRSR